MGFRKATLSYCDAKFYLKCLWKVDHNVDLLCNFSTQLKGRGHYLSKTLNNTDINSH